MRATTAEHESGFRRGHLSVTEHDRFTADHQLDGDFLLLVSSWERRSTEILNARHPMYRDAAVLQFAETGESGRRAEHDQRLTAFAAENADNVHQLAQLSSADFFGWRDALFDVLLGAASAVGRPIDVVVDLTCLPKYFALLLFGFSFHAGLVRRMSFFYAEGRYAPSESNLMLSTDHSFTLGDWRSLPVPYLEGELNPERKIRIIASIGFETFQARKFIRTYEAEQHILIVPSPGLSPEYQERAEAEAQALATNLDIGLAELRRAHAGSAIVMANDVIDLADETHRHNDVLLCLGTKPHALGMGIAALLRPQLTLVCRIPSSYAETETPATGKSWIYDVLDLSAAPIETGSLESAGA
jgi:hypothetical protein